MTPSKPNFLGIGLGPFWSGIACRIRTLAVQGLLLSERSCDLVRFDLLHRANFDLLRIGEVIGLELDSAFVESQSMTEDSDGTIGRREGELFGDDADRRDGVKDTDVVDDDIARKGSLELRRLSKDSLLEGIYAARRNEHTLIRPLAEPSV